MAFPLQTLTGFKLFPRTRKPVTNSPQIVLLASVAACGLVLLAGCGSGGSTTASAGSPALTVSPSTTLTFPNTAIGQTSATQTFTLTNSGNATLTLGTYTIAGASSSFIESPASTCGATSLAPNAICTLIFSFNPQSAGALTETVTATDNAATPSVTLTLTGTGVAAPTATLSTPTTLTFGTTPVGTTSAAQSVTLTNTGNAALAISGIVLGGTNLDQFSESTTCTATLAALASCTVSAAFVPTQAGTFSAGITITDNSNNVANSTQVISLVGTSAGAIASFSPSSITFPGTTLNATATAQTVTLTNTGGATLNITSTTITGGTTASAFSITANTCGATLAATSSCSISVTFKPTTLGANLGYLSVVDNAPGSPQTVTLNGTGQSSPAPIASLSATTITFPSTLPNTTTAASSVTLTNTGSAVLNIASIVLGGTNASNFNETNTCGTTLAVTTSCTISATFTPSAVANYSATVTLTDNNNNVANSTQTVTLSGSGATTSSFHTLYIFPESDNSATPLYALVNGATKTIDMTMYALQDTTFTNDLVAACKRGVVVRVILDQNNEKSNDTPDFNLLNAQPGCTAVWANKAFAVTHEKSFIVDGTTVAIMSLNLQSQYYSTTRDYAIVENDANDIAAIEATFSMDFAAGTTAGGTVGTSDYSYQPPPGTDLIWSPTTATTGMLAIINNATKTLYIENEEFSASNIVSAVAAAANRGVTVTFVGENESSEYSSEYATIKAAGANVYYYSSSTGFYVHGKTVVADLGLSTQAVYMGSINYSTASLTQNRELGFYSTDITVTNPNIAAAIAATIVSDETGSGVTHY